MVMVVVMIIYLPQRSREGGLWYRGIYIIINKPDQQNNVNTIIMPFIMNMYL